MINWQSQPAEQLILQKLLIMRPSANIAIFRLGISLLTAIPIACFYTNKAISQTNDISPLLVAADNSAAPANAVLTLQKLEIKQDETATNFNQLPDFPENNAIGNKPDICSTINQTDCETSPEPAANNLVDSDPKCHHHLHCNVLTQNLPSAPPNLPPPPTQPDPNRDRFLQPAPQPSPEPPQIPPTVKPQPPSPVPQPLPNQLIQVQKIQVVGSTILSADEINALIKPFEGRSATLEQLKQIADKITEIYLNRGYITSRAVLPAQTITAGVIEIQVLEGKLGPIEVEGNKSCLLYTSDAADE